MKYQNLRLPGTKLAGTVYDRHKKIIFEDKHTVIEIDIASYDDKGTRFFVAGHNCYVGEQSVKIEPKPENGLYKSERGAVICMLSYLSETFGKTWPEEVVKILQLAIWENRQTSFFD